MSNDLKIRCEVHGEQQLAYVCQHIAQGLSRKERVGFFWGQGSAKEARPDAWCAACNERVTKTDGEWVGAALENLKPQMLCAGCYDVAKQFHMGGNPWS